ncbi:MAG: hypothetical protein F6K48_17420 [Okeania sp. SIO3H1]|nr:hypothetical protein [Okeania sp. SIO3H1]
MISTHPSPLPLPGGEVRSQEGRKKKEEGRRKKEEGLELKEKVFLSRYYPDMIL